MRLGIAIYYGGLLPVPVVGRTFARSGAAHVQ